MDDWAILKNEGTMQKSMWLCYSHRFISKTFVGKCQISNESNRAFEAVLTWPKLKRPILNTRPPFLTCPIIHDIGLELNANFEGGIDICIQT